MKNTTKHESRQSERGFTLIEVLVSVAITLIVMAAVFGLLTRGQRAFEREPEIADLQQSARSSLDVVARDALQAGSGLPPEFPAFSRINGAGDNNPTDIIEMIGAFQSTGNVNLGAEGVVSVSGQNVYLSANATSLEINDFVVIYNNVPNDFPVAAPATMASQWALAQVTDVQNPCAIPPTPPAPVPAIIGPCIVVDYGVGSAAYSRNDVPGGPLDATMFFMGPPGPNGERAWVSQISVVRYYTLPDDPTNYSGPPPLVLMRSVDFDTVFPPQPVGYLEDFEIQYTIGVAAPVVQDMPPDPVADLGVGVAITAENMISGVRVTVTGRSVTAGMEGATQGASGGQEDDFIRKTFSTNVNPRNIGAGIQTRVMNALSSSP
jgi:prepilin-type N-terminal cleavage/methylation domain-containing protein